MFAGVCIESAARTNTHRQIEVDLKGDVAKYIDRQGLSSIARRFKAVGSDRLPWVQHHAADDRFIPLTRFETTGESIIDDVCRVIRARAESWQADSQRLYNSVFELGYNVEQHASSTGLVAVQYYPGNRTVEFAVGDHGVGIERSLEGAGFTYESTEAAIRAAVETPATASSESGRGKGLPSLLHHVCGDLLRGSFIVQSGTIQVEYRYGCRPKTYQLGYNSPGTLVVGQIATR